MSEIQASDWGRFGTSFEIPFTEAHCLPVHFEDALSAWSLETLRGGPEHAVEILRSHWRSLSTIGCLRLAEMLAEYVPVGVAIHDGQEWIKCQTSASAYRESDTLYLPRPTSSAIVEAALREIGFAHLPELIELLTMMQNCREHPLVGGGHFWVAATSPLVLNDPWFNQFDQSRNWIGSLSIYSFGEGDVVVSPSGRIGICNGEELLFRDLCESVEGFSRLFAEFRRNAWSIEDRSEPARHASFGWYSPDGSQWWSPENADYEHWRTGSI